MSAFLGGMLEGDTTLAGIASARSSSGGGSGSGVGSRGGGGGLPQPTHYAPPAYVGGVKRPYPRPPPPPAPATSGIDPHAAVLYGPGAGAMRLTSDASAVPSPVGPRGTQVASGRSLGAWGSSLPPAPTGDVYRATSVNSMADFSSESPSQRGGGGGFGNGSGGFGSGGNGSGGLGELPPTPLQTHTAVPGLIARSVTALSLGPPLAMRPRADSDLSVPFMSHTPGRPDSVLRPS